jgi:hypothetical protein
MRRRVPNVFFAQGRAGAADARVRQVEVAGSLRCARESWSEHVVGGGSGGVASEGRIQASSSRGGGQASEEVGQVSRQAAAYTHGVVDAHRFELMPIHLSPSEMMTTDERYPTAGP